jgi:hypothetical protein
MTTKASSTTKKRDDAPVSSHDRVHVDFHGSFSRFSIRLVSLGKRRHKSITWRLLLLVVVVVVLVNTTLAVLGMY